MGGPVRLRVVFEDPFLLRGSQRRKGLHQCWLQLRPDLATIADLAAYLHQTFGLRSSCPRGLLLYMDNFILPSFESTCILKDEDIIMVKKNGVVFKDVLKVSDSQNQLQVLQSRQTSALNNSNLASKELQGNSQADEYDLVLCGGNTAHMETLPSEKGNAQNKRKHSHKLQDSDDTLAAKDSEGDSQGDEDNVGLHGNITCNETSTRKMISKRKRKLTKKLKSSDTSVFKDSQGDSQDEVDVDLANGNAAHKETPSEMTNAKNKRKKSSKFKFIGDSLAIKDSQGDSHRDEEDVDLHGNAMQKEAPSQIMKANHERKYSKNLEASNTAIMNCQGDLQEAEVDSGFPIGNIVCREAPSSKMTNSKHKRKLSNKFQSSDTLAIKDSQGDEEDLDLPNVNVAHPEIASSEKRNVKHKRKHSDNLRASEKQSKGNAIAPASENADGDARKIASGSGQDQSLSRRITHTYRKKKATLGTTTTPATTATLPATIATPPDTIATPPGTTTPPSTAPPYHSPDHHHAPYYPYPPPYYPQSYYPYPLPHPQPPYPQPPYPQPLYPQPPYSHPPPPPAEAPVQDERMSIEPEGKHFNFPQVVTNNISSIIKENFSGSHSSWTKIPQEQRDVMFRDFQGRFRWLPQHDSKIREKFHHRAAMRYRDMMLVDRKKGRPPYIGEADWAGLQAIWGSVEYEKVSSTNKKNRSTSDNSGSGAPVHTGGSIPSTEHWRRLRHELGRDPTPYELHARTHQRHGTQQWMDPRAERVHEEYMRIHEQYTQSSSGEGSSSGASSRPSDLETWRKAVGEKKKGRTYGLGARGYAYDAQTSHTSTSDYSGVSIQDLLRRYDELTAQMSNLATQVEVRELRRDLKSVQEAIGVLLERSTPPT